MNPAAGESINEEKSGISSLLPQININIFRHGGIMYYYQLKNTRRKKRVQQFRGIGELLSAKRN